MEVRELGQDSGGCPMATAGRGPSASVWELEGCCARWLESCGRLHWLSCHRTILCLVIFLDCLVVSLVL